MRQLLLTDPKFHKTLIVSKTNETRLERRKYDLENVPHHVTQDILKEQGQVLREHYPALGEELIVVMMVAKYERKKFAQKMLQNIAPNSDTTIFVCSCRRTLDGDYDDLLNELQLAAKSTHPHVTIKGYNLNRERNDNSFNPYLGLIDQANHIFVLGTSSSIISEALASGKSVYTDYAAEGMPNLYNAGFIYDADRALDEQGGLKTHKVEMPNQTLEAADKILQQYYKMLYGLPQYQVRKLIGCMPA